MIDGQTFVIEYAYDGLDHLESVTYPSGLVVAESGNVGFAMDDTSGAERPFDDAERNSGEGDAYLASEDLWKWADDGLA